MRNIKYIVVHCSATKPSMTVDIDRVRRWHLKRGWNDVGYHLYVRQDGTIEPGRPIEKVGAHVKDYNSESIGICYEGGIDESGEPCDTRTDDQKFSLRKIISELESDYPGAIIQGHRDFPNVAKSCPCFDAKEEYKDI